VNNNSSNSSSSSSSSRCRKFYYIVMCFLGNMTRKFTWVSDLDEYLLDNHSLHSQIQLFVLITSLYVSSSVLYILAPLISVSSALLRARLSWALIRHELYWSLAEVGLLYPVLGLNREHLEGFRFARCYATDLLFPREYVSASNNSFVTVETPLRGNNSLALLSHGPLLSDGCVIVRLSAARHNILIPEIVEPG
jgi:hypothetical protein